MNLIKTTFRSLILISALLAACQGAAPTTGEPARETEGPPALTPTAPPAETPVQKATAAPSGLAGQVVYASDVSGQPDEPLADQLVLALPLEQAGELLGAGEADLADEKLRFLKVRLPQADPAIAVTVSDAAGNYTLSLPPGDYILCVAESESTPPGFPAATRGCGRTSVQAGMLRRVDISSGFGEIVLVEPDP